jgi:trimeric autotransporter adhesin
VLLLRGATHLRRLRRLSHFKGSFHNTASGSFALLQNTTGSYNTASGAYALKQNTTGLFNTANGDSSLRNNTTGYQNTAMGFDALNQNTSGAFNTAIGYYALLNNMTGGSNIAIGYAAGRSTTGTSNIMIGNNGVANENSTIRIGDNLYQNQTFIAGVSGVFIGSGSQVFINSNGQLGTITSSKRFKQDINSIGTLSDRLLKLRPVSFRYKKADEKGEHPIQYGLIAEEVAKVFPELVQYDKEGNPFTVYYHLLTPLLLGEVQRQQAQLATQQAKLASVQSENQRLRQQLTTLQAQQEQMLKAVNIRLNELERAVQVNGKAPQAPATVLTALPSASR